MLSEEATQSAHGRLYSKTPYELSKTGHALWTALCSLARSTNEQQKQPQWC